MSSAAENNGEVAVEKVAADATAAAVKEDKQITKPASEETTTASDNGTTKPAVTVDQVKGTKRPADEKTAASKKAKKESAANASDCSDDEILEEEDIIDDSDIESDEYDLPYTGEEDDEENDVSGSDDQA